MPYVPRILAFAGSTREASFNKRLVKLGVAAARQAGAEVTLIDFRDLPMPLFDEDLEKRDGLPQAARKFKDLLLANDGLLISAPEYNSSISGVLKNAIDWASRPVPGEAPLGCFEGKVAALMAASPGALGGLRGLVTLRSILGNIKVLVLPDQVTIMKANEAFDESGELKDPRRKSAVEGLGKRLAETIGKLKG